MNEFNLISQSSKLPIWSWVSSTSSHILQCHYVLMPLMNPCPTGHEMPQFCLPMILNSLYAMPLTKQAESHTCSAKTIKPAFTCPTSWHTTLS